MIKVDVQLKNDFDSTVETIEITKKDILQLACDKAEQLYYGGFYNIIVAYEDITINLKS